MPELPDVAQFQAYFNDHALGQTVAGTHIVDPRILADTTAQRLGQVLKGHRLVGCHRHGKHLFAEVSGGEPWLLLHFGMTGNLAVHEDGDEPPRFTRARFDFENGNTSPSSVSECWARSASRRPRQPPSRSWNWDRTPWTRTST